MNTLVESGIYRFQIAALLSPLYIQPHPYIGSHRIVWLAAGGKIVRWWWFHSFWWQITFLNCEYVGHDRTEEAMGIRNLILSSLGNCIRTVFCFAMLPEWIIFYWITFEYFIEIIMNYYFVLFLKMFKLFDPYSRTMFKPSVNRVK